MAAFATDDANDDCTPCAYKEWGRVMTRCFFCDVYKGDLYEKRPTETTLVETDRELQ